MFLIIVNSSHLRSSVQILKTKNPKICKPVSGLKYFKLYGLLDQEQTILGVGSWINSWTTLARTTIRLESYSEFSYNDPEYYFMNAFLTSYTLTKRKELNSKRLRTIMTNCKWDRSIYSYCECTLYPIFYTLFVCCPVTCCSNDCTRLH